MIQNMLTIFDQALDNLAHYKRYPQMKPWIGSYYGKQYKKVLFIGESHYLPEGSSIHMDSEKWDASTVADLSSVEYEYTDTRNVVIKNYNNNSIFTQSAKELSDKGILPPAGSNNVFEHFAFYNFFLRPAYSGESLQLTIQDINNANEIFDSVISIIKPAVIIFLSSKAWESLKQKPYNTVCDFVPHPRSWARKGKQIKYSVDGQNPLTGDEKLNWLISNYILQ